MKAKQSGLKDGARRPPCAGPALSQTPIEWWRFKHADGFDDCALRDLRAAIGRLEMLGEPRWIRAAGGDAASAIGIVFRMRPEDSHRPKFDMAMTALAVCAAAGDSSACLVMAHVLRRLPAAGKAEAKIATSWLVKAFGKIASRRFEAGKGKSAGDGAMKVQIFSDLHLDFPGARGMPPLAQGVSLVMAAGDTCQGLVRAIEAMRRGFPDVEVAAVAGNHEYYGYCLPEELEAGRARAKELGVHLIENDTVTFGRLRVIGATVWTDYELFGANLRVPAMRAAGDVMRDHKRIKWQREPWQRFRPEEARALHLRSRAYIDSELAKEHDGPSLVLTHHAPTIEAVAPQFQRSLTSAAYASELLPLVDRHRPRWWVSGHTHTSMNFRRGLTRMISNPCGYADENPFFDPLFTIEVDHD